MYELVNGLYVLIENGMKYPPLQSVAIGYISPSMKEGLIWRLKKHGHPDSVETWVNFAKQKLSPIGQMGKSLASEIHVIKGPLNIDDLNNAVKNPCLIFDLVQNAIASSEPKIFIDGRSISEKD